MKKEMSHFGLMQPSARKAGRYLLHVVIKNLIKCTFGRASRHNSSSFTTAKGVHRQLFYQKSKSRKSLKVLI
jgi:23S rRNA C2498 (ribose-2'-O)-methylase RlmM